MIGPDPRVLPGFSARAWWRAVNWTLFGALGLCVHSLPVLYFVHASHHYTSAFGVATLVSLAGVILIAAILLPILVPGARRKQQSELTSGYTTLMPEFDQVDGIDPMTKSVARPARTAALVKSESDQITTGADRCALHTGRTPLQIAVRRRTAATTEVISLVTLIGCVFWFIIYVLPVARPSQGLVVVLFAVAAAALNVAVIVPAVEIRFAPAWYYTARLRERQKAPAYQATPSNPDIVAELAGIDAPAMPGSKLRQTSYLVCQGDNLVLYSRNGTDLVPYLDVPRSRIVDARVGSSGAGTGGSSVSAPVLTFRKDNGTELKVAFSLTAPTYTSGRKRFRQDSQEIVDWASSSRPQPEPT